MVASPHAVFAATALEKQNGRVNGVAAPLTGRKASPADFAARWLRKLHPLKSEVLLMRMLAEHALSTSSPSACETQTSPLEGGAS